MRESASEIACSSALKLLASFGSGPGKRAVKWLWCYSTNNAADTIQSIQPVSDETDIDVDDSITDSAVDDHGNMDDTDVAGNYYRYQISGQPYRTTKSSFENCFKVNLQNIIYKRKYYNSQCQPIIGLDNGHCIL